MTDNQSNVDQIIDKYKADQSALIQILLDIQRENRWLSKPILERLSQQLEIPINRLYHLATFYKAFSLIPQGRHTVSVCQGTACHVRGSRRIMDRVTERLNIHPGETSADYKFSLIAVNCLGCCALGPVMEVDDEYYSDPSTKEIERIVARCD